MHKLILNELFKIIKKKSFFVITIITLVFSVFCNFVYSSLDTLFDEFDLDYMISEKEKELKEYKMDKDTDIAVYIEEKTYYDKLILMREHKSDKWKYKFIEDSEGFDSVLKIKNTCNEESLYNEEQCSQNEVVLNKYYEILKQDDWKKAAKYELEVTKKSVEEATEGMDKNSEEYLYLYYDVEKIQFRIDNNISYADVGKNNNLNRYYESKKLLLSYDKDEIEKLNKSDYNDYVELKKTYLKDEYMLSHNYDSSYGTLSAVMENFYMEFEIIILVMILMISGTMMSQEYNKGTIKLLLVKPYSRWKILLSKYLTVLLMIFLSYLMIFLIELICGGLMLGFDTINQPILQYNTLNESLVIMNCFKYNLITFLGNLPFFIFMATVAFAISTIFGNTAVAIISGFAVNMVGNILAMISQSFEWTKYLVFNHLDISNYLISGTTKINGDSVFFSIGICLIYILVIIIPTFIIFQKKDIKNV